MKKKLNPNVKLALLRGGSFVTSFLPLAIVIGLNWNRYTATPQVATSLTIGGGVAVAVTILKALGKLPQKPKRVIMYGFVFAMLWVLEPLILDLKLLVGAALVGEIGDMVAIQPFITYTKKQVDANITAKATAEHLQMQPKELGGRT